MLPDEALKLSQVMPARTDWDALHPGQTSQALDLQHSGFIQALPIDTCTRFDEDGVAAAAWCGLASADNQAPSLLKHVSSHAPSNTVSYDHMII